MIKGRKRLELTKENILERISCFDIYTAFSPKFKLGKKFSSPMPGRKDSDPSFIIGVKNGNYYHCDYGDSSYYGDCFNFVMQIRSCDYYTALRLIDTQFGLGIQSPIKDWKSIISSYSQPIIKDLEQQVHIECHYKKFTHEAHKYWNAYHLSEEYLKNKNVFQIKQLFIARQRVILPWNEIVFAYITEEGKKKIYRPTVDRKDKTGWRFRSNIPFTYIFGMENLKKCEKALIQKSYKDQLVTSLITPCVGSVQAESIACFSKQNLEILKDKEVFLIFGADSQGVKESQLITSSFGWKYYNTEDKYMPYNDVSEVAKYHGLEVIEKHMKLKQLL